MIFQLLYSLKYTHKSRLICLRGLYRFGLQKALIKGNFACVFPPICMRSYLICFQHWITPNTENSVSETLDFQSSLLTEKIATHKSPLYYVFSLQVTYLLSISDYENVFDVELSSLLLV